MLGGSSSINGLVWVRGQPLDYDTWAQMGCRGWSWRDVAPVFTRMENFVDGDGSNGRGTDGPLKVSTVPDQNPLYDALFAASKAAGFKLNPDYNSEDQEGVVKTQTSIYKGRRMSVAHCYIEPAMKRSNLHVVTDAHDPARAARGQALRRRRVREGRQGRPGHGRARPILSAGGVASPQILELSGIGQPELLKKHGIEVKHELPAVGENFRDHINARIVWRVKDPKVSYNHMARGLGAVTQMMKYLATGGGFMSLPSAPLLAFLRTRPELATPDVQMHIVPYSIKDPKTRKLQDFPSMTIVGLPAAAREPGLDPHPLGRSQGAAGDPLQLPGRPDRPGGDVGRLPHDPAASSMRRRWTSIAARNIRPARTIKSDERDPRLHPQQLADRLSPDRHLPHGPGRPATPWSTTSSGCTASRACGSPTPRSSRPCRPATPTRPRSWSARRWRIS